MIIIEKNYYKNPFNYIGLFIMCTLIIYGKEIGVIINIISMFILNALK